MSKLSEIEPKGFQRVYDLAKAAGVDVSDWGNYKKGQEYAAANPKYCYEWAFVQPRKVVVLNFWHAAMQQRSGNIVIDLNLLSPGQKRWLNVQDAVKQAIKNKLPIRVIVLEGKMGNRNVASKVHKRLLDPAIWRVTSYDPKTGDCILTRSVHQFVDQHSIRQAATTKPERRDFSGQAFIRNAIVRSNTLLRAGGMCEWCKRPGFKMADGKIYLETHHVVSLSEGGFDTESNVAALCPNHHREAHHGKIKNEMRRKLIELLKPIAR